MKTLFREIKLDKDLFQLELDENHPQVSVDGRKYTHLDKLCEAFPQFTKSSNVGALAVIANFLFSGLNYEVIEDVNVFSERYKRLLKEDPNVEEFGQFNIAEVKLPRVEGKQMIFYVEAYSTGLPFKVTGPFPFTSNAKPFAYTLLSYI